MVQVNATMNGKETIKRIHFRMYLTTPILPSSRASWRSGGVERMGGKKGMSTRTASSSLLELSLALEGLLLSVLFSIFISSWDAFFW